MDDYVSNYIRLNTRYVTYVRYRPSYPTQTPSVFVRHASKSVAIVLYLFSSTQTLPRLVFHPFVKKIISQVCIIILISKKTTFSPTCIMQQRSKYLVRLINESYRWYEPYLYQRCANSNKDTGMIRYDNNHEIEN